MNKIKKTSVLLLLLSSIFMPTLLLTQSCENDDLFNLDEGDTPQPVMMTRAGIDMSEYLELPSYDPKKWTDEERIIVGQATERIGVTFNDSKHRYEFAVQSCNAVNIADSLYYIITSLYEHTNKVMASSGKKNKRRKLASGDVLGYGYDCVPAAISNMGENAPTYSQAIAKCTEMFPRWTTHGVDLHDVKGFIEVYASVYGFNNLSFCSGITGTLPNLVTCYRHYPFGSGNHAVNSYSFFKTGYTTILYYQDVSSASQGNGSINAEQLMMIYPFASMFN